MVDFKNIFFESGYLKQISLIGEVVSKSSVKYYQDNCKKQSAGLGQKMVKGQGVLSCNTLINNY